MSQPLNQEIIRSITAALRQVIASIRSIVVQMMVMERAVGKLPGAEPPETALFEANGMILDLERVVEQIEAKAA